MEYPERLKEIGGSPTASTYSTPGRSHGPGDVHKQCERREGGWKMRDKMKCRSYEQVFKTDEEARRHEFQAIISSDKRCVKNEKL